MTASRLLFGPYTLRGITSRNRMVLAPMSQHSAMDGIASDWHLVHLAKFALGGFGIVMTEACAIEKRGRISYGDLGIWDDSHILGLSRIASFLKGEGAVAAIQIAHSGRKGSFQRPWQGNVPLSCADAEKGEPRWPLMAPSPLAISPTHVTPEELGKDEISKVIESFAAATRRSAKAGFQFLEIHGAHGYLIASFLSPETNRRMDEYGGDRPNRMRFALEVTEAVRHAWPQDLPLFFRMSCVDGAKDGWGMDDSVALAKELKALGVDLIDCSSGGLRRASTLENDKRHPGFQVPYAAEIREQAGIATMAGGLILNRNQAEGALADGAADLIAIGRQATYDPYWAHHAAQEAGMDSEFQDWSEPSGWWLRRRTKTLQLSGYDRRGCLADQDG